MLRETISFLLYFLPLLLISFVTVFIMSRISLYYRKSKPTLMVWVPVFGILYFMLTTTLLTYGKKLSMGIWIANWGWSIVTFLLILFSSFMINASTKGQAGEGVSAVDIRSRTSIAIFLFSWLLMLIAYAAVLILCLNLSQK
jgi:hypothetical protein